MIAYGTSPLANRLGDPDQRSALERSLLAAAAARVRDDRIAAVAAEKDVPVSLLQQRIWFFQQLSADTAIYQTALCWLLRGELDSAALRGAVADLVQRHAALRTRIMPDDNGVPVLIVDSARPDVCTIDECATIPVSAAELSMLTYARLRAITEAPFDLAVDWPFRARLLTVGARQWLLAIVLHHTAYDGHSLRVLRADLSAAYLARLRGAAVVAPPGPVTYRDYAHWLAGRAGSPSWAQHLDYWRDALGGTPDLTGLPTDRRRADVQQFRGGAVDVDLPPVLAGRARELSRALGCTTFVTLMAAFHALLHRYSNDDTSVVGTPVSLRDRPELADVVGLFVNTLAIRADFTDRLSFVALIERVRAALVGGMDHREVPFDEVVAALNRPRQLGHNPVFQTMFQFNIDQPEPLIIEGITCEEIAIEPEVSTFDLAMYLSDDGAAITGWLGFSRDLFDERTAKLIAAHYLSLLEAVLSDPYAPVENARVLAPGELTVVFPPAIPDGAS